MRLGASLLLRETISLAVWLVFWITIGLIVGAIINGHAWIVVFVLGGLHGLIAGVVFVFFSAFAYRKNRELLAIRGTMYAILGGFIFFVALWLLLLSREFSVYIPLIVIPIDAVLGCGLSLFLFRNSLSTAGVHRMRTFQNVIAWVGWIILVVVAIAVWRAPDSAKHAYAWAARKTMDPLTSMQDLDNFPIDESDFNAPEHYYPEDSGVWLGGILKWFREPSIYESGDRPAVRLVYDRSFFDPVLVRLSCENGKWFLVAKRLTGGVHIPIHLDLDKRVPVPESLVNGLKKRLDQIGFWSMPTDSADRGLDGADWVLEARLEGRYHVVDRWSPKDNDEYKKICIWLLREGGVADGPLF